MAEGATIKSQISKPANSPGEIGHEIIDTKNVKLNINTLFVVAAIVVVFISVVLYNLLYDITPSEIENYECPDTPIYIPANGKRYEIDAFSKNSQTSNVQCEWTYDNNKKPKILLITGKETCKLKLQNTISTATFNVKLTINSKNDRIACPVKIIFHAVPYFGIDLGTTYSSISYQKSETDSDGKRKYEIVILDNNKYSIPTAIYISPNSDDSLQLGEDALNMRHKYPGNVIYDIKRIIGRRASDNIRIIKEFNNTHSFIVDVDTDNKVIIKIPKFIYNEENIQIATKYINYYPEETLSPILTHLVHTASKKFNVPYIKDIVISVPAYFNNHQRKAIINSCKIAHLNPIQLVVEPTAAALSHAYYSLLPQNAFDLFMVFDYGGGTLDCSILQCYGKQNCEVFYVGGNSILGGIDYDHVIVDIMKNKFKKHHSWQTHHFTPQKNAQFLLEAEKVKLQLTKQNQSHPIWMSNGITTEKIIITRSDFENDKRTQQLLNKAIKVTKQTINDDPDHTEGNLKMILLVGGTSQIPIVRKKLQNAFGTVTIPEPDKECELTVVKGTSVIGGELAFGRGGVRPLNTNKTNKIDVTPYSLGFKICNGSYDTKGVTCDHMDIVVKKGSRYPVEKTREYEPYNDAQMKAILELYEGNHLNVSHNAFLSEVTIYGFTETLRICDVIFQIDKNGMIEINATVRGKEEEMFIMNPFSVFSEDGALTDEDIAELRHKMVKYDIFPSEIQSMFSQ